MDEFQCKHLLHELNASAKKLLAGPEIISNDERKLQEKKFVQLRGLADPLPLCKYVLENTEVPLVQFEAVSAMIEHMVRKWVIVTESGLEELLSYLMAFLLSQNKIENYVREQLILAVSVLIKRKLIDDISAPGGGDNEIENMTKIAKPENTLLDKLCQRLESLISDTAPHYNLVSCSSIVSLMVEFGSLAHSSRFGMPWEIHLRCKVVFEKYYMLKFCVINLNFLKKLSEQLSQGNMRNEILSKSLNILNHVVTWNFTPNVTKSATMNLFKTGVQAIAFKPPNEWKDILLDGSILHLLYRIHGETRNVESLCQLTLLCFIQMASLNGEVFGDDSDKSEYLKKFIENFLEFATQFELTPQETAGFAGVISQMMSSFPIRLFANIRQEVVESFLRGLAKLTIHCAERATIEDTLGVDGAPYLEAFELLLLAWVTLLSEMGGDIYALGWFNVIGPELFGAFLKFRLTILSGGSRPAQDSTEPKEIDELEEDDRDIFIEHLSSIATIARTICSNALPMACELLEKCGDQILNFVGQGDKVPVSLFEDFHWLILLIGHICVDIAEGEEVQIPSEIRKYSFSVQSSVHSATNWPQLIELQSSNTDQTEFDPIIRIVVIMCKWAKVETLLIKSGQMLKLSPQVASDIMWFFLHWSQPYLFYNVSDYEDTSGVWQDSFSGDGMHSNSLLSFLVEKAISNIHQWSGQDQIQSDSLELLSILIRSPQRHKVVTSGPMFWELVEQFGSGAEVLKKLSPEVQLSLAGFIGKSMAKNNWEDLNSKVIGQICARIVVLTKDANMANIIIETDSLLSALSGIARMCPSSRADTFLEVIFATLNQITDCLKTPEIVSSLLSLLADIAESCLTYFSEPVLFKMYNLSLKVLELFSSLNKGLSIQSHPHLEEDRYADLVQLMDILISLMSWDFVELSEETFVSNSTKVQSGDVVFYGLDVVLHFMAKQFLSYPSLCNKFFNLLTLICETYPDRVANLPMGVFHTLASLLEIGLFQYDSDVGKYCLDAVSSLAIFGKQNQSNLTQLMATQLRHLLSVIFKFLIDENFDMDLVSSAAETLFYLVLGNPTTYSEIIQRILDTQDKCFSDRLTEIFSHLNPELHQQSPSKKSVIAFGNALERELPKLRGILCIK
ncbi:hypothetical protein LOD99_1170 [Oopsacas minuta]|uniref:Exportin-4 n=1 Tax=Oopsacas minuta TaxID=111878 RepID=A0AAV7K5Y4_9METZ|nr:hypothetical protein LOD99_1170 [Oopsacas minuta]